MFLGRGGVGLPAEGRFCGAGGHVGRRQGPPGFVGELSRQPFRGQVKAVAVDARESDLAVDAILQRLTGLPAITTSRSRRVFTALPYTDASGARLETELYAAQLFDGTGCSPLIGSGDWNDGMNRVGAGGRGESVWLGWFLHATLTRFAAVCTQRGDDGLAAAYRQRAEVLRQALEQNGWDGEWYLRAFYDDGAPLGSAQDAECQIDGIAQAWAVLSGAAEAGRAAQAMSAVQQRLVLPEDGLLLLFTPPFDKTPHDPGYIKGYLPGIRENGGQYTHGALWSAWAFAELGQSDTAEAIFRLLNPIYHADTRVRMEQYKVAPYVVAADVYGVAPHTGRGGWTWYTGSAAWMHRLGLEGILGLRRAGASLVIEPHIPAAWPGYEVTYRYGQATYRIRVQNSAASAAAQPLPFSYKHLITPASDVVLSPVGPRTLQ